MITVALTALLLVPDLMVEATAGSKVVLALTHLVAAAIIIPAIASRLADSTAADDALGQRRSGSGPAALPVFGAVGRHAPRTTATSANCELRRRISARWADRS